MRPRPKAKPVPKPGSDKKFSAKHEDTLRRLRASQKG